MKKQAFLFSGLAVGVVLAGLLRAAPEPPNPNVPAKLAKARMEAARKTYEAVWKNNQEGLVPVVEISYRWSCRWLDAERDLSVQKADQVAACQAHYNRMRDLEKITKDRFRARVNAVEEASSVEFYSLEAEIWLAQAKNK